MARCGCSRDVTSGLGNQVDSTGEIGCAVTVKRDVANKFTAKDVLAVARKNFGFEDLRPGQEEAILSLLAGHDTLAVQPTGSGKSAIYQIAGMMLGSSVLVVSPLIALQKDQVDSINGQTAHEAVVINSTLKAEEAREALEKAESGDAKFIFLAPEQLRNEEIVQTLRSAKLSLLVVDEAHCISQWGHDFRPDYLRIGEVLEDLRHPTVLALTATASKRVREEIIASLRMKKPKVFLQGFDRPNIYLRVDHFQEKEEKLEAVVHRASWADKPGIIYAATRNGAEEIAQHLAEAGVKTLFYHAGLKAQEREEIQDKFMSGDADVIVATNAFGMGVDKANVRFVYHNDICDSLDSYYQEIGRAGRDGEKAEAILFFRTEDLGLQKFHAGGEFKDEKRERLRLMQEYADTSTCRREHLLQYFGDDFQGPCGNCDNCESIVGKHDKDIDVDPDVGTRREVA
jgi:ATP-dependent DNA helicase RecQ